MAAQVGSAAKRGLDAGGPAELTELAIDLLFDSGVPPTALAGTLRLLASAFGCRSAIALRLNQDGPPVVLGAYPEAEPTERLIAELAELAETCPARPGQPQGSGTFSSPLRSADAGARAPDHSAALGELNALIAFPETATCRPTTILALIRPGPTWNEQVRYACRTVARLLDLRLTHSADLTQLTRARLTVRELITASPTALFAMDQTGRATEINPAAERLLGRERAEVAGHDLIETIVPAASRASLREWAAPRAGSGPVEDWAAARRTDLLRSDGTKLAVKLTPVRLRVPAGTCLGLFASDETGPDVMLESLRDSEARFRLLAALAPVGIVQFDAKGRCVFVNDQWTEWTGLGLDEMRGQYWTEGIHPDDVARVEADAARSIVDGTRLRTDCRIWTAVGVAMWADMTVVPLCDPSVRPVGYLAALTNVTDRKQYELEREVLLAAEQEARRRTERASEALSDHNERLRAADQYKTELLASVSHELRNPLTSVVSFTELIMSRDQELSPETAEFLRIISRNAEQLLGLVGDLLLLSQLEAGVIPVKFGAVNAGELISQVVDSNSAAAAARGVLLSGHAGTGPPIRGDELRLRQILDNLVSNAIKFSPEGGAVTVTAARHDATWRIDVTDQGIGIPEAEIGQLFTRFFRASNAQTSRTPGTGIGLSIVKTIAELHGGDVTAASKLGAGSTFTVTLLAAG